MIPRISTTERAALESGTVGFDRELFSGRTSVKSLLRYAVPTLTDEESAFMNCQVNELCGMIDENQVMNDKDLTPETWRYILNNKFTALLIPKKYGGLEFTPHASSQIVQKISSHSGTAAVTVMVPNSLGPGELLLKYGTQQQRDKYLPRLAQGLEIPCFGLTGPHSGSDAASMDDIGKVVMKGNTKGIQLSFNKRYITLAPVSSLIGLAFKLEDPDDLLHEGNEGITVALLSRDTPNLEIGARHDPLGCAFMNGPVRGTDVFIPMDSIIGGEKMTGYGWNMLMECLAEGRGISLPASSLGTSKMLCNTVGAYSRIRTQFKTPLSRLEGIQEKLADMVRHTYIMECSQRLMNAMLNNHERPSVLSAVMKQQFTERARDVIDHAMDITAGSGICRGSQNYVANAYQACPVAITVEGSNTLTRSLIIFGQGLVRSHPYLMNMVKAVESDNKSEFNKNFRSLMVQTLSTYAGSVTKSIFRRRGRGSDLKMITYYESQLRRLTLAFAFSSNMALLLGGKIKFAEMLSGRYADIFSNLFHGYAILWKNKQKNSNIDVVDYTMEYILYEIQESFYDIANNYPSYLLGSLIKSVSFPFGRTYKKPSDELTIYVADSITRNSSVRELFGQNIYMGQDDVNLYGPEINNIVGFINKSLNTFYVKQHRGFDKELSELRDKIIQVNEYEYKPNLDEIYPKNK